jgi:hypothetical protein
MTLTRKVLTNAGIDWECWLSDWRMADWNDETDLKLLSHLHEMMGTIKCLYHLYGRFDYHPGSI